MTERVNFPSSHIFWQYYCTLSMYRILRLNTFKPDSILTFIRSCHKYSEICMNMSQKSSKCVWVCRNYLVWLLGAQRIQILTYWIFLFATIIVRIICVDTVQRGLIIIFYSWLLWESLLTTLLSYKIITWCRTSERPKLVAVLNDTAKT